jgi:hypothetical protein
MAAQAKPITFPAVFPADIFYRLGAVLFSLVGVIGLGLAASRHQTQNLMVISIPFLVFLGALLLVMTLQISVDDTGLHQQSILGRKEAGWDQVKRLDKGQAYSIYGKGTGELVWLTFLSTTAQLAIAEEAIRRCDLRPSGAKLQHPVRQQWIRK